jgi:hypothetical protein
MAIDNQNIQDPSMQGVGGLKGLEGINRLKERGINIDTSILNLARDYEGTMSVIQQAAVPRQNIGFVGINDSMYDKEITSASQLDNIDNTRGELQPWYAQLGAGVAKGVALAGTTFLDGTIGLIAGISEGIGAKVRGESWGDSIAKLWDNEISNGLARLNESLEEVLPNYRTQEELDNPWYKNLGTMNFWADSVIKNLGFTVGALYSGIAGIKSIGAINKLLKLGDMSTMGTKVMGSVLSAVNEGRIEANHGASDFLDLQFAEIVDASIKQGNSYAQYLKSIGLSDEEVLDQLSKNDSNIARITEDARNRANAMGLTTLIGNTVLLSLDNFDTFGKLYARGYKNGRTIAQGRVTREAMSEGLDKAARELAQEEAGKRISKEGGKYIYDKISKKRAIARGIRHGLVEGNEEMSQAFISETAGQMQSPDSPDAYYNALLDPNAEIETKNFLKSVTEGFNNTYGNGDRWEEFAIGAITGIFGVPTFGSVQNSDANTWLGRGRTIGISGGLFGEMGVANRENAEGKEAVDFMNNYAQRVQEQTGHFVRSQSFTNAMDGWAEEGDAFEYKNAEDNSDFAAISRFAKVGRLGDLKDMVNQDFENLPDEELEKIAEFASPEDGIGGWRNADGSLMSDTEDGRAEMREELSKKRDKILSEIDKYEASVETVKAIGNNSLNEDQVNELAWLNWKVGMFTDRYNSIKEENNTFLHDMLYGLQAFQRGRGVGMLDEESEEGKKIMKAMDNAEMFVNALLSSKTPLQFAATLDANKGISDFIEELGYYMLEDIVGTDAATFENAMTALKDAAKIAKATKNFNDRYKEFRDNPIELIKNRQNIAKKKEKVAKATNDVNSRDKINSASVSDIVAGVENGDLDMSVMENLFSSEDNAFLNNDNTTEGHTTLTSKEKVEEAKKIIETSDRLNTAISELGDSSIDSQAIEDALTLVKHSKEVSESEQELIDTATQAYNDPSLLYDDSDPLLQNISQEEIASVLDDRLDAAKSVIEQAKAILAEQNEELSDLPTDKKVATSRVEDAIDETNEAKIIKITPETSKEESTGHDATSKIVTENERRKEIEAKDAEEQSKAEEKGKIQDFFNEARQSVAPENRETFDKTLSEVISNIDMLLSKNTPISELGRAVMDTQSYKALKTVAPSIDEFLNTYVTHKNKKPVAPKVEEKSIKTPLVTTAEVRMQTTAQSNTDPNKIELSTHQYWKPTISYLPFGKAYQKGDLSPFYTIAKYLQNDNGTSIFTETQLRRIEAVGKYLDEHGAFKLVDSGGVKVGDTVSFVIDSTLNDVAGEIVILMADSQGRIIGDVMSQNDVPFQRQAYLPAFVEKVIQEYKDAGSPQYFKSSLTTVVDKNMVGKVPYLADHIEMNTLNDIHSDGNNPVPFLIGIAASSGNNVRVMASPGRTKKQGQSDLERSINPPVIAQAGQPFLLMPTSSAVNHYMPVPIMMEPYSPSTQNTALGQAIRKVLERIPTADNNSAIDIIRDLEDLISVQEIHINYSGDTVKVTIKPNGVENQMPIYNGAKNAPNIVEQLEYGLQGQPFQVSRKYMNDDYNGQDYNRMIGEIAKTNLPIGATHTVSDWFTLKPIDATGKIAKAKSPRSTGRNPHAAEIPEISVTKGGITLYVNTKTWEVSNGTKTYEGKNADKVKAYAFGIHNNKNMEQPYDTAWGYYNPTTDSFIEKPNKTLKSLNLDTTEETAEQLVDKMKKAGLLNNGVREALWAALTPAQQATIANKKGPKRTQWMDALETAWTSDGFDESKLKGSVDEFLGRKALYRIEDGSRSIWNREKELSWMKKALPNLSAEEHLTIIDGLIKIVDSKKPGFAYGKFQEGMITISDVAARGTMYHEAFHAVVHTLLNGKEYQRLLDAATERWEGLSGVALEEKLAEDFRMFMQSEEEWYDSLDKKKYGIIKRTLATLYHKLQNLIKELSGKTPYINRLYYSINRGKFSRRKVRQSDVTRFSEESYTSEMQAIKENAIANNTFMKAPNSNPTNLTERQWLQVRTKAFKEWFGDWQNDPENASKVVDENGEPLAVYHGSRSKDKISVFNSYYEKGTFFSTSKNVGSIYSTNENNLYSVFINSKNPLIVDNNGKDWNKINAEDLVVAAEKMFGISKEEYLESLGEDKILTTDGIVAAISRLSEEGNSPYDGFILKNVVETEDNEVATDIVTFKSNQIKSATDNIGTFSTTDDDIRYRTASTIEYTIADVQSRVDSVVNNPMVNKTRKGKNTAWGNLTASFRREGYLVKGYWNSKTSKWTVASVNRIGTDSNQETYYRRVEQYHRDKLLYDNLSQENKEYLQERGISIEEYKDMTQLEKEVLFKCKY